MCLYCVAVSPFWFVAVSTIDPFTYACVAVFAGTVAVSVSFPLIFLDCFACVRNNDMWGHLLYYGAFIAIFQFGWASTQIAHMALMIQLTQDNSHQTELSGLRSVDHHGYISLQHRHHRRRHHFARRHRQYTITPSVENLNNMLL